jgi:hypothetical protein
VHAHPPAHGAGARAFFRALRRCQDGRLGTDADGARLEPWLLEEALEPLLGPPPRSPAQALCLSDLEPSEALLNVERLVDYVARYLHQSWESIEAKTWAELEARFRNVVDMVRAENGKPPRGQVDPDQKWL